MSSSAATTEKVKQAAWKRSGRMTGANGCKVLTCSQCRALLRFDWAKVRDGKVFCPKCYIRKPRKVATDA